MQNIVLWYVGISAFFMHKAFLATWHFDTVCKPLNLVAFAVCVSDYFAFTVCARNTLLSDWFLLFDVVSLCTTFVCTTASPEQRRLNGRRNRNVHVCPPARGSWKASHAYFSWIFLDFVKCFQKCLILIDTSLGVDKMLCNLKRLNWVYFGKFICCVVVLEVDLCLRTNF